MLNDLTEYGNIIKKTQGEVKLTLVKQRKNDREPTVEGMKLRFKSTIWNIRKKKAFHQNSKKKKELKKARIE